MTIKTLAICFAAVCGFNNSIQAQQGLQGEYFNGQNFDQIVLTRTDAQINFAWNNVAPAPGLDPHVFSVRWTGKLQAPETGTYLFRAHVDDGIRVMIDGKMVINAWGMHDSERFTGEIALKAGQSYPLQVEYFNALLEGEIQLYWQLPSEAPVFKGLLGYNDHPIDPRFLTLPTPAKPITLLPNIPPANIPPAKTPPTAPKKQASKPAPIALKAAVISRDTLEKYIPKNILFEKSKSIMLAESEPELDRLSGFLLRNPKYRLTIEGHTDHIGNAAKNLLLSEQRAQTVAAYLTQKGVDSQRITSRGYGDTKPLVREAAGIANPKKPTCGVFASGMSLRFQNRAVTLPGKSVLSAPSILLTMTILGNIFLGIAALVFLLFVVSVIGKETPRGSDALMGYAWSIIIFYLFFLGCMTIVAIAIGWRGGFDWISPSKGTQFLFVAGGLLATILTAALSGLFKGEPGATAALFRIFSGFAPVFVPLVLLVTGAILLNDGLRTAVPVAAYKIPLMVVFGLGILGVGMGIFAWISQTSQNSAARLESMQADQARYHQDHLNSIEACDVTKNMSNILVYTDANHDKEVREKAIEKIKTNPEWQQELIRLLENKGALEAFTFLAYNEVDDKTMFLAPVNKGVLSVADWIRRQIREASQPHHFYQDQFSWEIERMLRTVDKFKGLGTDYRPAVREVRAAFDEPTDVKKPEFNCIIRLESWIKKGGINKWTELFHTTPQRHNVLVINKLKRCVVVALCETISKQSKTQPMSWHYKLALAVDVIGAIVALYFIISDSIRYSSSSNGLLSMVTLVFCAWLGISYYLYHHGQPAIASIMAWIPAVPLLLYGLFVLMFIILKPDMR